MHSKEKESGLASNFSHTETCCWAARNTEPHAGTGAEHPSQTSPTSVLPQVSLSLPPELFLACIISGTIQTPPSESTASTQQQKAPSRLSGEDSLERVSSSTRHLQLNYLGAMAMGISTSAYCCCTPAPSGWITQCWAQTDRNSGAEGQKYNIVYIKQKGINSITGSLWETDFFHSKL